MHSESDALGEAPFPLQHAADVPPRPPGAEWLVEPLWSAEGVGLVGGLPKCLKTWVAAEIAVAVASGKKALGRFPARAEGPVVVFTAEDEPADMRPRFEGICQARGTKLKAIPIFHLDVSELRLDDQGQLRRLRRTLEERAPRLLILDPFVRLVRDIDENSAVEVASVLGALRLFQRELHVAVLLVHHMRKTPSAHPGQQLRGSGDFAAWLDSGIYLTRRQEKLLLTIEHRRAAAPAPFFIRLETEGPPHLVPLDPEPDKDEPPALDALPGAILRLLGTRPRSTRDLRDALHVRKASLLSALRALEAERRITRQRDGWAPASPPGPR